MFNFFVDSCVLCAFGFISRGFRSGLSPWVWTFFGSQFSLFFFPQSACLLSSTAVLYSLTTMHSPRVFLHCSLSIWTHRFSLLFALLLPLCFSCVLVLCNHHRVCAWNCISDLESQFRPDYSRLIPGHQKHNLWNIYSLCSNLFNSETLVKLFYTCLQLFVGPCCVGNLYGVLLENHHLEKFSLY